MRICVVDSHTGGEPTRVVLSGGPDLGPGSLFERRARFAREHDAFRAALVNEPRGSDAIVGALLCAPADPACDIGAIFFNNVGYLGMCGHATIGLVATLAHLGRLAPGDVRIDTPVGPVTATLDPAGPVTVRNVPGFRHRASVPVEVPGFGVFTGDIAWGGNWFYLVHGESPIPLSMTRLVELTDLTWRIRRALAAAHITGADYAEIDHIELFAPPHNPRAHSRNFVLCPGGIYDRSPCGTGTSAKLACLYVDGKLAEGQTWVQESVTGSLFEGHVRIIDGAIIPFIKGSAYITAEADLVLDERDPFCCGIPA